MEGTGTGATAMLVGTPEDVGGRPDAATVTVTREEIEEALASNDPLDLILSVKSGETDPQDVRVAWERSDLEKVLAGIDSDAVTFSFDRAELQRALEQPDFEGHGIREMVLLTVAAASASAALAASTASGQLMDGSGVEGGTPAAAVQPGDPGTIPYLSHGIGVDESVFQGEPAAAAQPGDPGTIPYLSHGQGVDESLFQGEPTAQPGDPGRSPTSATGKASTSRSSRARRADGAAGRSGDDPLPQPRARRRRVALPGRGVAVRRRRDAGDPRRGNACPARRRPDRSRSGRGRARGARRRGARDLCSRHRRRDDGKRPRQRSRRSPTRQRRLSAASARPSPERTRPGLTARGVEANVAAAVGTGDATTARDLATPRRADSGTSFELPSVDTGTAAAIGALAGAGLIIVGAAFVARRRVTPV